MIRKVQIGAAVTLLALLGLAAGAFGIQAHTNPLVWSQIQPDGLPTTFTGYSVFMVNGTDGAWIAGEDSGRGQVLRLNRDGDHWTVLFSPGFRAPLRAVVATGDDTIWALGDNGLIIHRGPNEHSWTEMPNPVPEVNLTTIQMFGNGEEGWAGGWVAGSDGNPETVLLHYQHDAWQRDARVKVSGQITGLHFAGGTGYAVGGLLGWRYSGGAWRADNIPCRGVGIYGCSTQLTAVRTISGDEAWAVGTSQAGGSAGILSAMLALHRVNGQWQEILPQQALADDIYVGPRQRAGLNAVSFTSDTNGLAVGWQHKEWTSPNYPLVIRYWPDGFWHYESIPYASGVVLNAVSHADATHALAVGNNGYIIGYGYGGPWPQLWPTDTPVPGATTAAPVPTVTATATVTPSPGAPFPTPQNPVAPVPPVHDPAVFYFAATGHSLHGPFRDYWTAHGGLPQFGYPLTEQLLEGGYTVQYFERARFELHPELPEPFRVSLGLLGHVVTAGREQEPPFLGLGGKQPAPGTLYFPATDHAIAPEFVAYWQTQGGLPIYGYPISEPFTETSPTDGLPYLVQYFERNRFELHPELPEPFRVSLGLLGSEVLRARGWLR